MNLKELKNKLDLADELVNLEDYTLVLDEGRDGIESYPEARVFFRHTEGEKFLAVVYD